MKFGQYLIEKGKIDEYELEEALKFQQEHHINLGVLAIRESLLTNKHLSTILDHQRVSCGCIGEIAVELKLLHKNDIDRLPLLQKGTHNLLGDILVLYGAISKCDMEEKGAKKSNLMNCVQV